MDIITPPSSAATTVKDDDVNLSTYDIEQNDATDTALLLQDYDFHDNCGNMAHSLIRTMEQSRHVQLHRSSIVTHGAGIFK